MSDNVPTVRQVERAAIVRALAETDTRREAAEALGFSVSTLYRRLNDYGLRSANLGFGGVTVPDGDGLLSDVLEDASEDTGE